tara:strand:- start:7593 stop:8183 length:591 start_codon:yes stop_codon:yes gene_type:complete
MHACLLVVAIFYTGWNYAQWSGAQSASSTLPLVCSEFSVTRVQGLVCAAGILALCTSSHPLTLGLALSTLKAVADGCVFGIMLAGFTWRASASMHATKPMVFFGALFVCTCTYTTICYRDDKTNRTGGPVLATSFGMMAFVFRLSARGTFTMWLLWCRARRAVARRIKKSVFYLYRSSKRTVDTTADTTVMNAHSY